MLDFHFKRQMQVSALLESIIAVVDVEPLLYPCIDAKELDQNLVALHRIQYIEVDELRNERREAKLHIETRLVELFYGLDSLRGGG